MSTDNPNDTQPTQQPPAPPAPPAADVGALLAKIVQLDARVSTLEGKNVGLAETVRLQARRIEALEAAPKSATTQAGDRKGVLLRSRSDGGRVLPSKRW